MQKNEIPLGRAEDLRKYKFGRLKPLYRIPNKGKHVMWHCLCDCGNECDVASDSLKTSNRPTKSCGCLAKEVMDNNLLGKRFGKLVVLQETNKRDSNKSILWLCKCDCGNILEVSTRNLKRKRTWHCGCSRIASKGEEKISQLLEKNNVPYKKQHTFANCRFPDTEALARFDFFVDDNYLIEYDGEQHFGVNNGWNTEERYKKCVEHDNFKNAWAKQHKIPIIRIPYTRLTKLTINDLLLNTSNYVL